MEDYREGMEDVREGMVDIREGKEEVREGIEEDRQIGMECTGLVIDTAIPELFCVPFLPVGFS